MEALMTIVNWVIAHKADLLIGWTSLVTLASIIVKLTPTIKDNEVLLTIIKFVSKWIALNRTTDDEAVRASLVAKPEQPK